jgi:hypothetical protein
VTGTIGGDQSYATKRILAQYPSLEPGFVNRVLRLLTFVSLEHKYLYCAVPKAGCTLIKTLIHAAERLPNIDISRSRFPEYRREMFIHDRSQFRMPSLADLPSATQKRVLTDPAFFRFTVVRNPYRRLESAWRDKVFLCAPGYEGFVFNIKHALPNGNVPASFVSFPEFIEAIAGHNLATCDHHWRLQTVNIFYPALNIDHVGRIENVEATVEAYLRRVGRSELMRTTKMNASVGSMHYTPALARRVHDLYGNDFEVFGYPADSWGSPDLSGQDGFVSEAKYNNEILERNIIIGLLYRRLFEASGS